MKKFSGILLLSFLFVLLLSATAFAYVPRWPEPAWYAQFYSAPEPQPEPVPEPVPQPEPQPEPVQQPEPAPQPAASAPKWPEPAWFAQNAPVVAPSTDGQAAVPQVTVLTASEQLVFDGINKQRVSRGLAPLKLNPELVELARKKSQDMIDNKYFAHVSPVYGRASDMMRSANIRYNYAGENLAKTTSANNAITLFMNSSTHRNTLLNPRFSETGIGIAQIGRQVYVTQMFIGFMR